MFLARRGVYIELHSPTPPSQSGADGKENVIPPYDPTQRPSPTKRKKSRDVDQTKRQRTLDGFFLSSRAEPSGHSVPNSLGLSFKTVASSSCTSPPSASIDLTLDDEVAVEGSSS